MQVKKRIFAGQVCEQVVYQISDKARSTRSPARIRFQNDEERAEHKRRISRRHHALVINANYTPAGYYITLTFDPKHEIYDFEDARRIRDDYYSRIRRKYPESKVNLYMGRGENTTRIHFHMICEGIPLDVITEKWTWGKVKECRHLRAHNINSDGTDCGGDLTALANYCFDHWTEEQGKGKRYKQSRTVVQPEEEKPVASVTHYSEERPPRAPKGYRYIGMSMEVPQYGYQCFKYVKLRERRKRRRRDG